MTYCGGVCVSLVRPVRPFFEVVSSWTSKVNGFSYLGQMGLLLDVVGMQTIIL